MEIKVKYNCDENREETMSLKTFVEKFNTEEINSATDMVGLDRTKT